MSGIIDKYRIEIDGSATASNGLKFINCVANWNTFFPRIERHSKYHGFLQSYSTENLVFTLAAKDYLKTRVEQYGGFASSTFKIHRWNAIENGYELIVDGSLDFNTYRFDVLNGNVLMKFFPTLDAEALVNRSSIETQLRVLEDFNGDAITSFTGGSGNHDETYTLSVTATEIGITEDAASDCEVMLVWECALRLAQKIIGRDDALRSTLLNRTTGEVFQSDTDGELAFLAITNGGLLRGGVNSVYPIQMSLDTLFDYINNVTPIGMEIEYINGQPFVRIEKIEWFYDDVSDPILVTSSLDSIVRKTNNERVFGKVFTGFRVFSKSSESPGSDKYIETVHSPRTFTTGLDAKSKKEYNVRTNLIASPQLIEVIRNNPLTDGTNDESNNQNIILQVKDDGASGFIIDNDFVSVTGINDPTTQKNYLITPGRTVLNHLKMINGCLIREYRRRELNEVGFSGFDSIKFQSGEGNTTASSRIGAESAEIAENENLSAGVEPIFYSEDLEIELAMTETEFLSVLDGLKRKFQCVYNGETFSGYIQTIVASSLNKFTVILKEQNENYSS